MRINFLFSYFVPNQGLNTNNNGENLKYDLFVGIFVMDGHFTAICKMKNRDKWYHHDNTKYEVISLANKKTPSKTKVFFMSLVYILFHIQLVTEDRVSSPGLPAK